jgi:hypothetical protein
VYGPAEKVCRGQQIRESPALSENAKLSKRDNFESASRATVTGARKFEKQRPHLGSTEEGMCSDIRRLATNVKGSSRDNLESVSNATNTRDLQREKTMFTTDCRRRKTMNRSQEAVRKCGGLARRSL